VSEWSDTLPVCMSGRRAVASRHGSLGGLVVRRSLPDGIFAVYLISNQPITARRIAMDGPRGQRRPDRSVYCTTTRLSSRASLSSWSMSSVSPRMRRQHLRACTFLTSPTMQDTPAEVR
jgi:hypothetical protein